MGALCPICGLMMPPESGPVVPELIVPPEGGVGVPGLIVPPDVGPDDWEYRATAGVTAMIDAAPTANATIAKRNRRQHALAAPVSAGAINDTGAKAFMMKVLSLWGFGSEWRGIESSVSRN